MESAGADMHMGCGQSVGPLREAYGCHYHSSKSFLTLGNMVKLCKESLKLSVQPNPLLEGSEQLLEYEPSTADLI